MGLNSTNDHFLGCFEVAGIPTNRVLKLCILPTINRFSFARATTIEKHSSNCAESRTRPQNDAE